MKALLISEFGALNGGEFSFLTALPAIQQAGFQFTAALPPDSGFASLLKKNNVDLVPFSFRNDDETRKPQDVIRDELSELIKRIQPAIVHANSLAASRIIGPVTQAHNTVGIGYLRDIIKLSRKAIDDIGCLDQIIAVSNATADYHIGRGLPRSRVSVIHNGVDLQRFHPTLSGDLSDRSPDSPVCLCIGQIGMRKGLDLSLEMLTTVFQQIPNAELWIVGQRHSQKQEAIEYEKNLHRFAKENFRQGAVKWMGRRTDIPELMRKAKLLVHAAKQEPLGRVLLEATASGLPIITTNVGGTPEILEGMEELMFAPDRFVEAAPRVIELLSDSQRHGQVSASLRSIAERKFSAERAGDDLAKKYRELCD